MEVRLLIAFLLMGAVMFLTPYLFKTQNPTPAKKDAAAEPTKKTKKAKKAKKAKKPATTN